MGGPRRLAVKGVTSLKQVILTCTISGFGKGWKSTLSHLFFHFGSPTLGNAELFSVRPRRWFSVLRLAVRIAVLTERSAELAFIDFPKPRACKNDGSLRWSWRDCRSDMRKRAMSAQNILLRAISSETSGLSWWVHLFAVHSWKKPCHRYSRSGRCRDESLPLHQGSTRG